MALLSIIDIIYNGAVIAQQLFAGKTAALQANCVPFVGYVRPVIIAAVVASRRRDRINERMFEAVHETGQRLSYGCAGVGGVCG